jgi:hypothetical protein
LISVKKKLVFIWTQRRVVRCFRNEEVRGGFPVLEAFLEQLVVEGG